MPKTRKRFSTGNDSQDGENRKSRRSDNRFNPLGRRPARNLPKSKDDCLREIKEKLSPQQQNFLRANAARQGKQLAIVERADGPNIFIDFQPIPRNIAMENARAENPRENDDSALTYPVSLLETCDFRLDQAPRFLHYELPEENNERQENPVKPEEVDISDEDEEPALMIAKPGYRNSCDVEIQEPDSTTDNEIVGSSNVDSVQSNLENVRVRRDVFRYNVSVQEDRDGDIPMTDEDRQCQRAMGFTAETICQGPQRFGIVLEVSIENRGLDDFEGNDRSSFVHWRPTENAITIEHAVNEPRDSNEDEPINLSIRGSNSIHIEINTDGEVWPMEEERQGSTCNQVYDSHEEENFYNFLVDSFPPARCSNHGSFRQSFENYRCNSAETLNNAENCHGGAIHRDGTGCCNPLETCNNSTQYCGISTCNNLSSCNVTLNHCDSVGRCNTLENNCENFETFNGDGSCDGSDVCQISPNYGSAEFYNSSSLEDVVEAAINLTLQPQAEFPSARYESTDDTNGNDLMVGYYEEVMENIESDEDEAIVESSIDFQHPFCWEEEMDHRCNEGNVHGEAAMQWNNVYECENYAGQFRPMVYHGQENMEPSDEDENSRDSIESYASTESTETAYSVDIGLGFDEPREMEQDPVYERFMQQDDEESVESGISAGSCSYFSDYSCDSEAHVSDFEGYACNEENHSEERNVLSPKPSPKVIVCNCQGPYCTERREVEDQPLSPRQSHSPVPENLRQHQDELPENQQSFDYTGSIRVIYSYSPRP